MSQSSKAVDCIVSINCEVSDVLMPQVEEFERRMRDGEITFYQALVDYPQICAKYINSAPDKRERAERRLALVQEERRVYRKGGSPILANLTKSRVYLGDEYTRFSLWLEEVKARVSLAKEEIKVFGFLESFRRLTSRTPEKRESQISTSAESTQSTALNESGVRDVGNITIEPRIEVPLSHRGVKEKPTSLKDGCGKVIYIDEYLASRRKTEKTEPASTPPPLQERHLRLIAKNGSLVERE